MWDQLSLGWYVIIVEDKRQDAQVLFSCIKQSLTLIISKTIPKSDTDLYLILTLAPKPRRSFVTVQDQNIHTQQHRSDGMTQT